MLDVTQQTFDGAERAGDALHLLDGMIAVLETELAAAPLGACEARIWPLVGALRHYRTQAASEVEALARLQAG